MLKPPPMAAVDSPDNRLPMGGMPEAAVQLGIRWHAICFIVHESRTTTAFRTQVPGFLAPGMRTENTFDGYHAPMQRKENHHDRF